MCFFTLKLFEIPLPFDSGEFVVSSLNSSSCTGSLSDFVSRNFKWKVFFHDVQRNTYKGSSCLPIQNSWFTNIFYKPFAKSRLSNGHVKLLSSSIKHVAALGNTNLFRKLTYSLSVRLGSVFFETVIGFYESSTVHLQFFWNPVHSHFIRNKLRCHKDNTSSHTFKRIAFEIVFLFGNRSK